MKDTENPALGARLQPYAGIPTFMRCNPSRDLRGVSTAILGVPFDSGTSYRSGTRFGPRGIRLASLSIWGCHPISKLAPAELLNLVDYGDVDTVPVDIRATMQEIEKEANLIIQQGVKIVTLGGDHSIVLPLLRAHSKYYGPVGLLQFDAHPDTLQSEFNGHPFSHGTPFRHAIQEGLIDSSAYIQVGVRCPTSAPGDMQDARDLGAQTISTMDAVEMGMPAVLDTIHHTLGARPVYVSLDIDALDPAFAPGTGTPEVGGFSSLQILQLVRGLQGLNLIGFDLVEVNPAYDPSEITAILAANLVFEFLNLLAMK